MEGNDSSDATDDDDEDEEECCDERLDDALYSDGVTDVVTTCGTPAPQRRASSSVRSHRR